MNDRTYRLLELHQKQDFLLAKARARRIPDPLEIAELRRRKQQFGDRLTRLLFPPAAMKL